MKAFIFQGTKQRDTVMAYVSYIYPEAFTIKFRVFFYCIILTAVNRKVNILVLSLGTTIYIFGYMRERERYQHLCAHTEDIDPESSLG